MIAFGEGAGQVNLNVAWIHGSEAAKYNTDPDIQVHACDEHTYILRQNKAVHYEAPFLFLLFGASRAAAARHRGDREPGLLPAARGRSTRSSTAGWPRHPHPDDYGLLVLHTHAHG